MKIGDEVYIHGYIDEIRKDTVIIRNDGGYFGTVQSEIITSEYINDKLEEWANLHCSGDDINLYDVCRIIRECFEEQAESEDNE